MALIGQKGAKAYERGHADYQRGAARNPFEYFSAKRGGDVMRAWWRAGYEDAQAGRERRFDVETTI